MNRIRIVGVGEEGEPSLSDGARRLVREAEVLIGTKRLTDLWPESGALKIELTGDKGSLDRAIEANRHSRVIVLASGDPGFYGIGRHLVDRFGKEGVEIIPNVSSMQLAFARIKESWDDAVFFSAHGRSPDGLVDAVHSARKIGIFIDHRNSPAAIARLLLENGVDGYRAYVCENLGNSNERVTECELQDMLEFEADGLSVLVLVRSGCEEQPTYEWHLGIPDEEFQYRRTRKGLITKLEVRVVSLAALRLRPGSVLWDIGAGSGAVSIEASRLASGVRVYAVERAAEDVAILLENKKKFGARQVTAVAGEAPAVLAGLPDPSAVFIGGSGGKMEGIMAEAAARLRPSGRVVLNLVTLENLHSALQILESLGLAVEVRLVSVSRSKGIAGLTRLEPLDPVFVVAGWRKGEQLQGDSEDSP